MIFLVSLTNDRLRKFHPCDSHDTEWKDSPRGVDDVVLLGDEVDPDVRVAGPEDVFLGQVRTRHNTEPQATERRDLRAARAPIGGRHRRRRHGFLCSRRESSLFCGRLFCEAPSVSVPPYLIIVRHRRPRAVGRRVTECGRSLLQCGRSENVTDENFGQSYRALGISFSGETKRGCAHEKLLSNFDVSHSSDSRRHATARCLQSRTGSPVRGQQGLRAERELRRSRNLQQGLIASSAINEADSLVAAMRDLAPLKSC